MINSHVYSLNIYKTYNITEKTRIFYFSIKKKENVTRRKENNAELLFFYADECLTISFPMKKKLHESETLFYRQILIIL